MPGTPSRRERTQNSSVTYPPVRVKSSGKIVVPGVRREWKGRQVTVSSGHRRTKGVYREGGPFYSAKIVPQINTRYSSPYVPKFDWMYSGPIHVPFVPNDMGGFKIPSENSDHLDSYGSEAISIVDPTNPNAEFGIALGEVARDGIPIPGIQAWRHRTKVCQAAGSEYLNAVFGWMPLVKDLKDTSQSILHGNTILNNYRAASGTLVHREFSFDDEESSSQSQISAGEAAVVAGGQTGMGDGSILAPVTVSRHSLTRRWFSGSFTYLASQDKLSMARMAGIGGEAEKLLGLSLTPDLVWELTPWSWAIDWFSNAGSVIHNAQAFGLAGLVMRYGYMMEETTITDTYSMPHAGLYGDDGAVPTSSVTYSVKRRKEANPFGFGVKWEGMSPTQLAITAALGITRLR